MPRQTEPNANNALGSLLQDIRIPLKWHPAPDDGRLLVLSPSSATARRPVAEFAHRVFVARAIISAKIEAFARKLAESSKSVVTLDGPANMNLLEEGAEVFDPTRNLTELDTHGT